MTEREVIAKIANPKDSSRLYFDRQLQRLTRQNDGLSDFALQQLVAIAEAKHRFSDLILAFVLQQASPKNIKWLVERVVSGHSSTEDLLPYALLDALKDQ